MDQLDKKYYRIADVAEMLGLPASTLRYWETEFPTLRPKRNAGTDASTLLPISSSCA